MIPNLASLPRYFSQLRAGGAAPRTRFTHVVVSWAAAVAAGPFDRRPRNPARINNSLIMLPLRSCTPAQKEIPIAKTKTATTTRWSEENRKKIN